MSTIKVDVSSSKKPVLQVGYQEENEVTDVLFDISAWVEEYGGGTAGLRVKRPQNSEEESYELSLPISENVATWTVSETDTYNRGNGKVQLKYYVGSALKESAVYTYKVGKSIVGSDNPVDPFDTWIERSKAWATGELLDGDDVPASDETYHNNAKYYANQAVDSAESAAEAESTIESTVQNLQAQFDNAMSAVTTDTEVTNIRVGADGKTYSSAGTAVRTQISDLKEDLGDVVITPIPVVKTDKRIFYTNVETASADYVCTDYVPTDLLHDHVSVYCTLFQRNTALLFYDADKNLLLYIDSTNASDYGISASSNSPQTVSIDMPTGTRYIRANMRSTYYSSPASFNISFSMSKSVIYHLTNNTNDIIDLDNRSDVLEDLTSTMEECLIESYTETAGYYGDNGTVSPATGTNYEVYTSKIYDADEITFNHTLQNSSAMWVAVSKWFNDGSYSRTIIVNRTATSVSETIQVEPNVDCVAISYRSYGVSAEIKAFIKVDYILNDVKKSAKVIPATRFWYDRFNPYFAHMFLETLTYDTGYPPAESLFDIDVCKKLGFKMIEANTWKTNDDKYVVLHGVSGGYFGTQFHHVDGVTDISNTLINSVTLSWIKTNVRYNSLRPKYRVAPPSLEEFLYECKKQSMIPVLECKEEAICEIANNIIGVDNYIAYNGERAWTNAPIMVYSAYTTKEQIVNICESYGVPFMYSMGNPTAFTDLQLKDIVDELHSLGYWIGYAGTYSGEVQNQRLLSLGFDFSASGWNTPEIDVGDICNLYGFINFNDFNTNGTVDENGYLVLDNGETVTPIVNNNASYYSSASLHIRFNGSITLQFGNRIGDTFTSDGTQELWFSTFLINTTPSFTITATTETEIASIVFKAKNIE